MRRSTVARCLRTLLLLLSGILPCSAAMAEESWPHLPSDAEIQAARDRLVGELSFDQPSCTEVAGQCVADPDEAARQLCIARACLGACILGPEVRKSRLTEIELTKAHHPRDPTARSAHVFAVIKVERTRDDCAGHLNEEIEYSTKMLEFGLIAVKVHNGAESAMRSDWVFRSQGIDYGVVQQDPASRTQRDLVMASYFQPGRLLRGFPGDADATTESYRMDVFSGDPRHPLRLVLQLEQQIPLAAGTPADAEPQYRPAAGMRVDVSALRFDGNEQRLAGYFESNHCSNCENSEIHGHLAQTLTDAKLPIQLTTGGDGRAAIEFFLDFGALEQARALSPGSRIPVPIELTAMVATANGTPRAVLRKQHKINVDAIGVVEAISYQPPQLFDPLSGSALPRGMETPLFAYIDDAGTRDGPRMLLREERVIVRRSGEATIGETGITPGHTLDKEHHLQVGDRIAVNACGMVSNRVENGLPFGDAGRIWVSLRYFDGLIGKFGVSGKVCRSTMTVGTSGEASGFTSNTTRFIYWAGGNGVEAAVVWLYPPLAAANYVRKVITALSWGGDHGSVYVVLQSAVAVEFDDAGALLISTREGAPRVITSATGEEGVLVPAGMSAHVGVDGAAQLTVTDSERGLRIDAWLAAVDTLTANAVDAGTMNAGVAPEAFSPLEFPGSPVSEIDWGVVITVAVPIMLLVVWRARRRGRKTIPATATAAAGVRPSKAASAESRGASRPKFCGQCGAPVAARARFCGACGTPLRE